MTKNLVTTAALFILLSGSASLAETQTMVQSQGTAPEILEESSLKKDINPCEDFYQFSCGGWLAKTTVPSDKNSVNRVSTPLSDAVDWKLHQILESDVQGTNRSPVTYAKKMADDYASCLQADLGSGAAKNFLLNKINKIREAKGPQALARTIAELQLEGTDVLFSFGSFQDPRDSNKVIADAAQGGMVFHDPDYYVNPSPKSEQIRKKYLEYMVSTFILLGDEPAAAARAAESAFSVEKKLASHAFSIADQNDPAKTTHLMNSTDLQKLAPTFHWDIYFHTLGLTPGELNVDEPEFFKNLDLLLSQTSKADMDAYLAWQLTNRSLAEMGAAFENAHFQFWDAFMNGAKTQKPRWQVCTRAVEQGLGYALAEAYVQTIQGKAIKEKTNEMIDQVKAAFAEDLKSLSRGPSAWMDLDTVKEAFEKMKRMNQKVGAPDKFRNYDSLETTRQSFLQNSYRIAAFESHRDLMKIGKPVDRTEWSMMPWEVNAYYDRSNNEFVFPFGILQPPSLDLAASDGANMGSFGGGTIGHELTHGFDNNGSKYNSLGNLKNWWSEKTRTQFEKKAQCFAQQADQYEIPAIHMKVKGQQTLEENMADQGGVKLGAMALSKILEKRKPGKPWLGQYNERQQYWIAYAQSWCTKYTDENLRYLMTLNTHPPAEFRVNSVVMNRPDFAKDFMCKKKDRMNPLQKCALW